MYAYGDKTKRTGQMRWIKRSAKLTDFIHRIWPSKLDVYKNAPSVTQAWPIPYPLYSSHECSGYGMAHAWVTEDNKNEAMYSCNASHWE